jgi:ElaB/YqjD/DUF883 family membrane-anchored ribosome-binding protein
MEPLNRPHPGTRSAPSIRLVILSAAQEDLMEENENQTAAGATSGDAGERESKRFSKARDYVEEKYGSASSKVKDGFNTVRESVEDVDLGAITDQVRTYVRSNPGKALLISVGVGFLVGLLLRRDDEE